jgi:hypothetical protein
MTAPIGNAPRDRECSPCKERGFPGIWGFYEAGGIWFCRLCFNGSSREKYKFKERSRKKRYMRRWRWRNKRLGRRYRSTYDKERQALRRKTHRKEYREYSIQYRKDVREGKRVPGKRVTFECTKCKNQQTIVRPACRARINLVQMFCFNCKTGRMFQRVPKPE